MIFSNQLPQLEKKIPNMRKQGFSFELFLWAFKCYSLADSIFGKSENNVGSVQINKCANNIILLCLRSLKLVIIENNI